MNILYRKKFAEDYSDEGNFRNFIEVCDSLGLQVFEVRRVKNPFAEPHRITSTTIYDNMTEFRETMPDWSAREYDYKMDRAMGFLSYDGISDGDFVVKGNNTSMSYEWHFQVLEGCVVVHTTYSAVD